jgi:hypothetical protein
MAVAVAAVSWGRKIAIQGVQVVPAAVVTVAASLVVVTELYIPVVVVVEQVQ